MSNHSCLNCGKPLTGKFCQHCGQRSDTHRITVKHFIMHDLLHGIWHFERGILFTLKNALLRPGYMAANYIRGKRIQYYNFFYLLLLVLGFNVLTTLSFEKIYNIEASPAEINTSNDVLDITEFINHNFKLSLFLCIPFFSLNSLCLFRKPRFNFAEHAVVAGVLLLCGAAWYILLNLLYYITYYSSWKIFEIAGTVLLFIILLTPVLTYWQATRKQYTAGGFLWRIILWYVLLLAEAGIITYFALLITGKREIMIN